MRAHCPLSSFGENYLRNRVVNDTETLTMDMPLYGRQLFTSSLSRPPKKVANCHFVDMVAPLENLPAWREVCENADASLFNENCFVHNCWLVRRLGPRSMLFWILILGAK